MDEEKKKKDNKTRVEMIIEGIGKLIAEAEGSIAQKTIVLITLIFGFVIALIKAPQYRNDILSFFCFVVALGIFYITLLIHEQSIS